MHRSRARLKWDEAFALQVLLAQRRLAAASYSAIPRPPVAGGLLAAFDAALPFELTVGQQLAGATHRRRAGARAPHAPAAAGRGRLGQDRDRAARHAPGGRRGRAGGAAGADGGARAAALPVDLRACSGRWPWPASSAAPSTRPGSTLLTGSLGAAARRKALLEAASGEAGIVIGTHALLEDRVQFADLGLVVIDEQHRFGVEQRDALRDKAGDGRPHMLVMTATPIPRTVAMTVFGDLEVSTLTELPGRALADRHPRRPGRRAAALPGPDLGADQGRGRGRPPGLRRLPADRRRRACRSGREPRRSRHGRRRRRPGPHGRRSRCSTSRRARRRAAGRPAPGDPARPAARRGEGEGDARLRRRPGGRAGHDHRDRGRRGRAQRRGDGDHGRRQVRRLPAAPAARPRRPRQPTRACACSSPRRRRPRPARERLDAVAGTLDGFALSRIDLEQRREGDVLGTAQAGRKSSLKLLQLLADEDLIEPGARGGDRAGRRRSGAGRRTRARRGRSGADRRGANHVPGKGMRRSAVRGPHRR